MRKIIREQNTDGALGILREFCSFVQGDVPIVSKTNVSVIIWLLLNVWMYWKIFINRKKL